MAERGITLSELIEKNGGVQTRRGGIADPNIFKMPTPEESQPEQSGGIGNMLLEGLKYPFGLVGMLLPDGVTGLAGGTLAEMLGNGLGSVK